MKDKVNATIDISEIKEKLVNIEAPTWKQIPIVYTMVGWILTLGGGAFFTLGIIMSVMGATSVSWSISTAEMIGMAIGTIIIGAVFTGLSHISK